MIGKSVQFLAVLVPLMVIVSAELNSDVGFEPKELDNFSHHLIIGSRQPGDHLGSSQDIIKAPQGTQIVTIDQNFRVSVHEKITQIRALDQNTNGKGATARLLGGGPGFMDVTLRFESQPGNGINFVLELYSK